MRRLRCIQQVLRDARVASPRYGIERAVAYGIIELQNTWSEFARALFLSYALRAHDPTGVAVSHRMVHVNTSDEALEEAVRLFNPRFAGGRVRRRDEPTWHQKAVLTRLVAHFAFSNAQEILQGLSVQSRVFQDLAPMRNFYAHKSQASAAAALSLARYYRVPAPSHPTDLVLSLETSRPESIGEDWIRAIGDVVEALT